jgi:hypothetical protein
MDGPRSEPNLAHRPGPHRQIFLCRSDSRGSILQGLLTLTAHEVSMTIFEKILEKECRVEALRAQIAKLHNDVAILEDAARILSDDEGANRFGEQNGRKKSAA